MIEYTFFWIIENYSYCWHEIGELLISPEFTAEVLQGTTWTLELLPKGDTDIEPFNMSLFLHRSEDGGPDFIWLNYELAILTRDGLPLLKKKFIYGFEPGNIYGWCQCVQMDEVLVRRKSEYLPHDNLSVRCKMWLGEGPTEKIAKSHARTRIAVRKISFLHIVECFSALEQNKSNIVKIGTHTEEECFLTSSLYCTDGSCCEEKIMLEIESTVIKFLSKCKLYLLDASGNKIECGPARFRRGVGQYVNVKLPLSLTKQVIMDSKSKYLTDDKLSLLCECILSIGLEFQILEGIEYELPTIADNIISNREATGEVPKNSTALNDLKVIYSNQFLTDIELKTKTTSFSVHKIVLCARSPVLKAMLSSDMKERNCDCIEIEDLEDEILNQFLLFLYCDNVENLQWDTATKLYYAADKYEVKGLKMVCSQFLEHNLSTRDAAELLILADKHSDSGLKQVVEDFILKHDEVIFGSDEWDNLIETNLQLALKTMQLKYKRKN